MEIKTALDWNDVHSELRAQLNVLPYNPDLRRMLNNITNMVTELSQLEVETRRTGKSVYTEKQISEINESINRLEKFLLIAKLMS